jgi:subtilisin family serine protease
MRKIAIILMLIGSFLLASSLHSETFNGKRILQGKWQGRQVEYVEGEILFQMKADVKLSTLDRLFQDNHAMLVEGPDKIRTGRLELSSPSDIFTAIANLNSSGLVEFAEPNLVDRAMYPPNDYYFNNGEQWWLYNFGQNPPGGTEGADIHATSAWDISPGSPDVFIGILDSGIPLLFGHYLYHSDLSDTNRYKLGADMVGDGDSVADHYGHGTHVLGIIGAMTNNEYGVAGVDWNCQILIDQVFDSTGVGTHNTFKNGVLHEVNSGVRVINYSGGGLASLIKEQAVAYADSHNVLLVTSVGNGLHDSVQYPAHYADTYQNVLSVSATTCYDRLADYSNYGPSVCVAAPGGQGAPWGTNDVMSTTPNYPVYLNNSPYFLTQNFGYMAGTSQSCGMVTGLASLVLSIEPYLTAYDLREIIELSADKVGDYTYYINTGKSYELGAGRINCDRALVMASGYTYVYGDANKDGIVTAGDVVYMINYLFRGGPAPNPLSAGDPNADCVINSGDVVSITNYLYRGGSPLQRGCVE